MNNHFEIRWQKYRESHRIIMDAERVHFTAAGVYPAFMREMARMGIDKPEEWSIDAVQALMDDIETENK